MNLLKELFEILTLGLVFNIIYYFSCRTTYISFVPLAFVSLLIKWIIVIFHVLLAYAYFTGELINSYSNIVYLIYFISEALFFILLAKFAKHNAIYKAYKEIEEIDRAIDRRANIRNKIFK